MLSVDGDVKVSANSVAVGGWESGTLDARGLLGDVVNSDEGVGVRTLVGSGNETGVTLDTEAVCSIGKAMVSTPSSPK
jgi:hypothetical protein